MSDYYSLIGVSRDATAGEIAIAYRQLVRQRHQELGGEANLGELSRAYRTISSIEKRREYDRSLLLLSGKYVQADPSNPTEADSSYLTGLEAMEKQSYQDAVDRFTRAVELSPGTGHFHSQLGLSLGMFRDRLAEAEQSCKRAVELEPDNPELFYNLGFLYQRHNLNEAAQEAFSQAQDALAARQARFRTDLPGTIAVGSAGDRSAGAYAGTADGDLLKELESLESTFNGHEGTAEGDTGADDRLKELESIEAQVSQTEVAEPARPDPEKPTLFKSAVPAPPPAPAPALSVDDLLRELAAMEEQVNQSEELHNGAAVEPEPAVPDAFAPTAPEVPDIFQETRPDDASLMAEQAGQLLKELATEPGHLPAEPVQSAAEQPDIEPLPAEPLPAEAPAEETPLQLETAAIEQPAVPELLRDNGHGEPVDPEVQKKVRQLEALESEMEEELQRIKVQRKKLMGAAT